MAVKNYGRLREILRVFARQGFSDVATRMKLEKFLPSRLQNFVEAQNEIPAPERLRKAFEELGPTFVKFGQLLAARPDLIPEDYVAEFAKLQDNVVKLPFETIRDVVERELGMPLAQAFAEFDPQPLAAASIAQVHAARLASGEKVVVKIQRPGLDRLIAQDVSLLEMLSKLLERYVPETRVMAPSIIVDEFFRTLFQELDFAIEANNIAKIRENLKDIPEIAVPNVHKALSTHRVLTMERFEGTPMNNVERLRSMGVDLKKLNEVGARAFFKSVMLDGLFHGDLHGGNMFLLNDGRLGLIDFGIVGRLSVRSRRQLTNMVLALITEDFETLCYQYAELGSAGPSVDFDGFQREVRNTLSPYLGLAMGEMNSGRVLIEATKIATKYQIRIPGDWMLVFKALFTVEGLGRTLDPEFDMMKLGQELVKDLIKEEYSADRIGKDLLWVAKDVMALAQVLPRQIRWMLKKFQADGYAFEVRSPELSEINETLRKDGRRRNQSMLAAALFVASAIALSSPAPHLILGYPVAAVLFFVMASYFWWRTWF